MADTTIRSRAGGGKSSDDARGSGSDDSAPAAAKPAQPNAAAAAAAGAGGASGASPSETLDSLLALLRKLPPQRALTAPPPAALVALFFAVAVFWWACVGAGVSDYEGRPAGVKRVAHALIWYDDAVVRPIGSVVPFVALLARVAGALGAAAAAAARQRPRQPPQTQQQQQPLPALAWSCLAVYCAIAAARGAVYGVNLLLARCLRGFHVLSDHLFLTGSIVACLTVELAALCADVAYARAAGDVRGAGALVAIGAGLTTLSALTLGDGYFTARYFHHPSESLTTAAVVTLFFFLPVGAWLWRERAKT